MSLKSQSLSLAKQIYGSESNAYKQIQAISDSTLKQIIAEIDHAIASQNDLNAAADSQDIKAISQQINKLRKNSAPDDAILFVMLFGNSTIKTNADVLKATIGKYLVNLSVQQRAIVAQRLLDIDKIVSAAYPNMENQATKLETKHQESDLLTNNFKATVPDTSYNFASSLFKNNQNNFKKVSNIVDNVVQNVDNYKKSNDETPNNRQDLIKYIVDNSKRPIDYVSEMQNILNSSASQAQRIVRTESSFEYSNQMGNLMTSNKVSKYQILANGTDNVCEECESLDGTVYNTSEMSAGLTAPPFHPNCQCNIVMLPNDDGEDED